MIQRKQILSILFILPLFLFMLADEESHSSDSLGFIGKVLNFVILFGGLAFLLHKPIRNFLGKRARDIGQAMKDAKISRDESDRKLHEAKARLDLLAEEAKSIKKEIEGLGLREKERILEAASKEAERIKCFAQQEIERLSRAGIRELKEYTAELATILAQEQIQKKLTPEGHALLIDKSIRKLETLYEKSGSGKKIHARTG